MMNKRECLTFISALLLLLVLFQGCNNSSSRNSDYAPFPVDSWGVKYFSAKDKPIESKKWAYYYRKAYYRNGVPDSDSLATDFYMTGEKKSEGYLVSENPDVFNGIRINYYRSGAYYRELYDNGVPVGEWNFYLEDGTLSAIHRYNNGVQESLTDFKDGYKYRDGVFKDGFFYQEIYYYPSGEIDRILTYEDTLHNSFISESFYKSGRIKSKARFVKALDFATSHEYNTSGDVYNYDEEGHLTITNNDPKPVFPKTTVTNTRKQNISTWDRGYSYGWDTGYQDGVDGNDMWYSYDDSGKGGDFLDGYTSGYEDGYAEGRSEWREDNDIDEEDDEYY